MARVPGLSNLQDQPSVGSANRGRQATQGELNLNPRPLNPTITPVNTYTRPEQTPLNSNGWMDLANALSSLNPALRSLAQVQSQPSDADFVAAQAALMQTPPEQRMAKIRDGSIPEVRSLAGRQAAGEAYAADRAVKLLDAYNTSFDRGAGNVEDFIQQQIKEDIDQFKDDPVFMKAYLSGIGRTTDNLRNQSITDRSNYVNETNTNNIATKWSAQAASDMADGLAPADIVKKQFEEMSHNRDFLGLPFDKQNELQLMLADQDVTAGRFDLARARLTFEKQGPAKGSLMTDPKLGSRADNIMTRLENERKRVEMKQMAADSTEQAGQMIDQAWLNGEAKFLTPITTVTESGDAKELSTDSIEKMASERFNARSQQIAAERKETPEQTFDRELGEYSANGIKNPQWFNVMEAGANASTIPNISLKEPPPALQQGYESYKKLYAKAPEYLSKNLSSKSQDFYEMVRTAEEDLHMDTRQAFSAAIAASAPGKDDANTILTNQLESAVSDAMSGQTKGRFLGLFGGIVPTNEGLVRSELKKYASAYTKMGLGPKLALEKASERFANNYFNLNGNLIRKDERMPPNFETFAQESIKNFVEKHGEELGVEVGDLSIHQDGNSTGSWVIFNPSTREVFPVSQFPDALVTYDSMAKTVQERRTKAEQTVIDKQNKSQSTPKRYVPTGRK